MLNYLHKLFIEIIQFLEAELQIYLEMDSRFPLNLLFHAVPQKDTAAIRASLETSGHFLSTAGHSL